MKQLVSWLVLGLSMVALTVSLWPTRNITAERVVLKDKNGVIRAVLDANKYTVISLFSDDNKQMLTVSVLPEGAQVILRGDDERERIRLSTWGGNRISIMDKKWNKRIRIGDDLWNKTMGISFEKDEIEEIFLDISK